MPSTIAIDEATARNDLAAAHRLAVMHGLNEGTWNHISYQLEHRMLISPGYTHWSQVCASNLTSVNDQGTVVGGASAPIRPGWIIHYPLHQRRPDARCIAHVHSPYATALSLRTDIMFDAQSSQQAAQFYDDVAYFEIYDGLLDAPEEGYRMADALGRKRVLLLRNHGVVVVGQSIAAVYIDLYQFERACMYQMLACASATAVLQHIPAKLAAAMTRNARHDTTDAAAHYAGMKRLVCAKEPDYAE